MEQMEYNPNFKGMPYGEALIIIPEEVLEKMSTDQKTCYTLVQTVKAGKFLLKCKRCCLEYFAILDCLQLAKGSSFCGPGSMG
jgi:hypothetical protein